VQHLCALWLGPDESHVIGPWLVLEASGRVGDQTRVRKGNEHRALGSEVLGQGPGDVGSDALDLSVVGGARSAQRDHHLVRHVESYAKRPLG
jgi:hypothetical protein